MFRPLAFALVVALTLGFAGCNAEPKQGPPPLASARASARPLDRLAPGELAPGKRQVFGLEVPAGMAIRGQFREVAYVHGNVAPEALANYIRERVIVEHVEIGAARTVFPRARIKKGPPDRLFRIEVIAGNRNTELVVQDVTPRPAPAGQESLSNEERWRRAGRRPDGKPFDITELK